MSKVNFKLFSSLESRNTMYTNIYEHTLHGDYIHYMSPVMVLSKRGIHIVLITE